MRIGIDIDGVLGEQVPHILKRINLKFGLALKKSDINSWEEPILHTDISVEIETALLDSEYVLTMPLVKGARKALEYLSQHNEIIIATNRPHASDKFTIRWLRQKGLRFHEFRNTRGESKSSLPIDALVDDNLRNISEIASVSKLAILFAQPWNKENHEISHLLEAKKVYRAQGWSKVVDIIDDLDR